LGCFGYGELHFGLLRLWGVTFWIASVMGSYILDCFGYGELHFGLLRLPNFVHRLSLGSKDPTIRKLHPSFTQAKE